MLFDPAFFDSALFESASASNQIIGGYTANSIRESRRRKRRASNKIIQDEEPVISAREAFSSAYNPAPASIAPQVDAQIRKRHAQDAEIVVLLLH